MDGEGPDLGSIHHTYCEIRELIPDRVISWHAHPLPHVGSAELRFELEPLQRGGTRIHQRIKEHYPEPIGFALRLAYGLTPEAVERQFEACLGRLRGALDRQGWEVGVAADSALVRVL
jgi:uncharacterized protein YndB with AHSA1/START domain